MKRNYYLLTIICFLFLAACDKKKDRVFDESPTVRLNQSVANAQTILRSKPNGWIFQYFPGASAPYGGVNLFVNFTSAIDVNIQADYIEGNVTSSYKVYPGAGPILTFDTYNSVLDYFALPGARNGNQGPSDVGLGGDIEFLVVKASADSVILKGRKRNTTLVMVPVPGNASTIPALISNYRTSFNRFYNANSFRFVTASKTTAVTWGVFNGLLAGSNNYSFRPTDTGIDGFKEYTVDGITFKQLTYKAATSTYPNGYYANADESLKLVIL